MNPALVGFALGWVGSMPLGGPVSLFVFRRGAAGRYRDGILLSVGAAVAESAYCAAALFGYGLLMDRWPWLRSAIGLVGALIMVGLGIHFLVTRHGACDGKSSVPAVPEYWVRDLTLGFSMVALNPSVLVNWLAVLAALHAVGFEVVGTAARVVFVVAVALGITGWFTTLIWLLHHGRARLEPRVLNRTLRVLGGSLCAAGLFALVSLLRR